MTVEFSSPIPCRTAPNGRDKNLPGDKYGRLTLVEEVAGQAGKSVNRKWLCQCDCSATTTSPMIRSLRSGSTTSCGCVHKATVSKMMMEYGTKHGLHGTPAYRSWKAMKARCANQKQPGYKNYGDRGIGICSRWAEFDNFYADMGPCPAGMSLDRKDNSLGYSPENCVWATRTEQNRNQRSNRLVSYMGRNICVAEAAEIAGIRAGTVRARLNGYGWPISKALGPEFGDPLFIMDKPQE
jgi:hypothetical protein